MLDPHLHLAEYHAISPGLIREKNCKASRNLLKEIPTPIFCETIPEPPSANGQTVAPMLLADAVMFSDLVDRGQSKGYG